MLVLGCRRTWERRSSSGQAAVPGADPTDAWLMVATSLLLLALLRVARRPTQINQVLDVPFGKKGNAARGCWFSSGTAFCLQWTACVSATTRPAVAAPDVPTLSASACRSGASATQPSMRLSPCLIKNGYRAWPPALLPARYSDHWGLCTSGCSAVREAATSRAVLSR